MASTKLVDVEYSHESAFCETTTTTATRIPVVAARVTRQQPRIPNQTLQVRQNAFDAPYLGPREATLELDVYWCGRGSLGNTATTETWLIDLLTNGLGGQVIGTQGELVGAGSDADTVVGAGTGTPLDNGYMFRVGAIGDGRAEGRWGVAASSSSGLTYNSLVGWSGTPTQTTDTIYKADVVYPTETGQGSERFLVGHNESGAATLLHGCVLTGLKFSAWTTGAMPMITLVYTCAYWTPVSASFPNTASVQECLSAAIMGGYYFYNTVGTTTYATLCPTEAQFEVDLGTAIKRGQCSTAGFQFQAFTGFERTYAKPKLTLKMPTWASTGDTLFALDGTSTVYKHVLMCTGRTAGRSVAVYLPKLVMVDPVPQIEDMNGVTAYSMTFEGTESTDETTNDLTKSAFRLAFG